PVCLGKCPSCSNEPVPGNPVLLLAFAVLMGFSRIYVGAHWFTDVIVGAAIGTALGIFVVWAIRRLFLSSL
ncbi:phosphatase PAP2 family protein, partial [Stomatohabitans albus]|uniref:phosphatase PAP2 family protein n=1 Tax=Stomatohabitans albus TaxID=3110766 RepID=UPI00300CC0CE